MAARLAQWTAFANVMFLVISLLLLQLGIVTPYGMFIAILAVIGFAIVTLCLVLIALVNLWRVGAKAGWASIRALFMTSIILAPFALAIVLALSLPPTFDTSSNLAFPPEYPIGSRGDVLTLPFMETILDREITIQDDRKTIETKRFTKDFDIVRDLAIELAADLGWQETSRAGDHFSEIRIGYTSRTWLLNLPIDVVLQISERENSVNVDMRSALRLEVPDLGYNAWKIENYFNALDERILALNIGQPN